MHFALGILTRDSDYVRSTYKQTELILRYDIDFSLFSLNRYIIHKTPRTSSTIFQYIRLCVTLNASLFLVEQLM